MIEKYRSISLIKRILVGIIIGALLGLTLPSWSSISILGDLFIGALKSIAPLLVFSLITASLAKHQQGSKTHMKSVVMLYLLATFVAALVAVSACYLFPVELVLPDAASGQTAPDNLKDVVSGILTNAVMNPVDAVIKGEYLSILFWASLLGLALRRFSETTKKVVDDLASAISYIVQLIIELAPFGITGLVYKTVADIGLSGMADYGKLIALVVGTMLFVSFVVYPLMVFVLVKQNPFPLTFYTLKESGIPAFFTRSSAVNVPINMEAAKRLGLDETSYSISIPLGATANSGGAAMTVTIMTLSAAHTLGMQIPFTLAFLLSLLAAISATGASGIAGGSLLLIPLACSLFNISQDVAMQVVGIGFIIGVIQDSVETAVNSASDLLFTATAEYYDKLKAGEKIDINRQVARAKQHTNSVADTVSE